MGSCRLGVTMVRPPILLLIIGCSQAIPRGGLHRQSFHLPPIKPDGDHPFTITVEGNVGAGKSTLLNFFGLYPEVAVHKEPLSIWKNLNGSDFLGLVMADPKRWGLAFESLVALTMAEIHLADHKDFTGSLLHPVEVMERSLFSWPEFDTKVDLTIYLRTSPQVAFERVKGRGREEESPITIQHIQKLHDLHEKWLLGPEKTVVQPVIVIDADEDISTLQRKYRHLAKAIYRATNKNKGLMN